MTDYTAILLRRARFAPPRDAHEAVASPAQERNGVALLRWRIRWSQRVSYPDALDRHRRAGVDAWFELHRARAREWIAQMRVKQRASKATSNVLTLHGFKQRSRP